MFRQSCEDFVRPLPLRRVEQIIRKTFLDKLDDIVLWPCTFNLPRQVGPNSSISRHLSSGASDCTSGSLSRSMDKRYPLFARSKPGLSVAAWAQYVLDNFATVQEAVNALRGEPFTIVTDTVPGETRLATLHLSMSDATGDSAIVEYIGGKQVIHHDRKYQVMTNSPICDEQLAPARKAG